MDFTRPVGRGYYAVVIPLKSKSNMWYFIDPFHSNVWILFFLSIPVYLIAMGLSDYVYMGVTNWDIMCGFVIRNALSEQNSILPDQSMAYQKIFIAIWTSTTFVLVQSYAGSLTAMLANPQLQSQIKSLTALEELLRHDDISLIIEKGTLANFYMSTAASDTMINQLYKRATIIPKSGKFLHGCNHTKITQCGNSASILDNFAIMGLTSADFSATGKCNFYLIEERIMISTYAIAFQVRKLYIIVHITSTCSFIAERKPFSRRF